MRQCGGLDPLVAMAKDPKTKEDKPLLAAVTGAIWKTAITEENVQRYDQLRTVEVCTTYYLSQGCNKDICWTSQFVTETAKSTKLINKTRSTKSYYV